MQRSSLALFAPSLVAGALCLASTTVPAQEPRPAATPAKPIATTPAAAPAKPAKKPVYDEAADARQDVAAAIARARRDNKRVLIQWGANWCGWCVLLAEGMQRDRDVATTLRNEYELVHVDVGRFDKHKDLAKELGADFKSIPFLTVLDADGKPIVQQNTEPFEAKTDGKNGHDPKKLFAWLVQHQAAPLDAKAVLAAGLVTAKEEQKLVFLHFGAPWCGWCHRLENWMARPEIAEVLAKAFVDVKIDTDRMKGGEEVYEAQLAVAKQQKGGIPWIAFLDASGAVVAHSTGPEGNCGFPYQPDEVAHFGAMLRASQRFTAEQIEALTASLHENRKRDEQKKQDKDQQQSSGH